MNKLLLFIVITVTVNFVKAQNFPIDSSTKLVSYSGIVKVDSLSKDELYNRARAWFSSSFNSAKAVLDMDDRQAGKLIGKGTDKGTFEVLFTPFLFTVKFEVYITVKDNRYRYEITQFEIINDVAVGSASDSHWTIEEMIKGHQKKDKSFNGRWKSFTDQVIKTSNDLIKTLTTQMSLKGSKDKDNF